MSLAEAEGGREPVPEAPTRGERRRVVFAGAIGSTVEFYDFGIYGYLATTIARLFFARSDPTAALLSTFAVFAVAFVARPLGSILFGHIGDRVGRKPALALAVLSMAVATFAIGLLPTYASIGALAPALLVGARLVQGLAAGGEVSGAAALLAETSRNENRGLVTSATQVASIAGLLLASGVVALLRLTLSPSEMADWGWRVPFILSLPTGLVALYVRRRLEEPVSFRRAAREGRIAGVPIVEVFRTGSGAVARAFGVCVLTFAGYYTVFVYLSVYLQTQGRLSASGAIWSTTATLLTAAVTLPAFGWLSDRFGRRPVMLLSGLGFLFLTLPMFRLMQGEAVTLAILGQIILGLLVSAIMGPLWAALAEMFSTPVRVSGMGISFNLAAALVGGTAPYIATWLIGTLGDPSAPAYFLMGCAVITVGTLLTMEETTNSDL